MNINLKNNINNMNNDNNINLCLDELNIKDI